MKKWLQVMHVFLVLAFVLASCQGPGPSVTTTPTPGEEPIYLAIIWHQHQPVYYKDPSTGVYAKPWVRVHATKDYVDMAAIVEQYPNVRATFNITPSLIRQLDDLAAGAKDLYWVMAEVPAGQLSADQKTFIIDRFFDINPKIIARFPRYQELANMRSQGSPLDTFSEQDWLDLQILFNLGWVDPDWLAKEPLAALVAKGRDFSEADKAVLFGEHLRLIREVIPIHKRLQDAGQIEVTMTPFAHPILPLLVSTSLAARAMPGAELPSRQFAFGQDAIAQVELGVELYQEHFGRAPVGMWPAEGSVAQEIVNMVSRVGIQWMASDEGVLANSLGLTSFTRNSKEVVTEPDKLYRPYYVQGSQGDPVAIVFRDVVISDKVGFTYSGVSGKAGAADFVNRIHAIRDELRAQNAEGPHLVSVILDGENAWEYYENDGKEFLHTLYDLLNNDPLIKTVTPSEFLELAPDQPKIDNLWAGSWISHDFSTWIGEDEENRAWNLLTETREFLQKYENGVRTPPSAEALEQARILMYIAEGSDWFWWYGADQNSGNDESFDQQYRDTLKGVYSALGEEPPLALDVPVIPQQAISADKPSQDLITPEIDGVLGEAEWAGAGQYAAAGGAMASSTSFFEYLAYGFDADNLYLGVQLPEGRALPQDGTLEIYLAAPGQGSANNFSRQGTLLGFPTNRLIEVRFSGGQAAGASLYPAAAGETWGDSLLEIEQVAASAGQVELAVPMADLGALDVGDRISMRAVFSETVGGQAADTDRIPASGPAVIAVPDLGKTIIVLDVDDPERDDHGPGTYTYPTDAVFSPGNYDILNFQVGYDDDNIVFRFTMRGPVANSWGSPNGLSIQTFDIYIDQDGDGQGGQAFLPGRNLALQDGLAWDYAITVEGWEAGVFTPGDQGPTQVAAASQLAILADPGQQKVTVRIPKSVLGDNPADWRYAAVVLGQEGYPSGGVMRVRDVEKNNAQWRFGGAPEGATNHTRVIDLVWATPGEQETFLSTLTAASEAQTALSEKHFARVPLLGVDQ